MKLTPELIAYIRRMKVPDPDPVRSAYYATLTPAQKHAVANQMFCEVRDKLRDHVRSEHPDWNVDAVHWEAAQLMLQIED